MTEATPASLQRLIAASFGEQGWEYDLTVGPQLVDAIKKQGVVDAAKLARTLPATFFQRNRVSRDHVAKVIERSLAGVTLREETRVPTTIVIGGSNYQVSLAEGASIVNSNINVGDGTQVVVGADAAKQDVLIAVEAILRGGLAGDWNDEAAKQLAEFVNSRDDLDYEDIQKLAAEVVKAEQPSRERVKDLLTRIAASGLGGALATGLTTGIGEAIAHIPV